MIHLQQNICKHVARKHLQSATRHQPKQHAGKQAFETSKTIDINIAHQACETNAGKQAFETSQTIGIKSLIKHAKHGADINNEQRTD